METLRTVLEEQSKIFNNMAFKRENMSINDDGGLQINPNKVQSDISELTPFVRGFANLYSIEYGKMYQVAGIGSRTLGSNGEIRKFMDIVGQVKLVDGESDPVQTIAPGLESIMRQFKLSVGEMDSIVKALAVATNTTKATSKRNL